MPVCVLLDNTEVTQIFPKTSAMADWGVDIGEEESLYIFKTFLELLIVAKLISYLKP